MTLGFSRQCISTTFESTPVTHRVGIDARMLGIRPKGIARYIWELCKAVDKALPEAEFFVYSRTSSGLPRISPRWHERVDRSVAAKRLPNSIWGALRVGFLTRRDELSVFWGGTGLLPLVGLRARSVLTVHDLVYNLEPRTTSGRARWAAHLFFRASVRKANSIVCNSHGSARRLEVLLGRGADAVIRPGVSEVFRKRSDAEILPVLHALRVPRPYLLAVGTWEPRKGLQRLIPAFLSLAEEGLLRGHILALAGERGWKEGPIVKLVQRGGGRIRPLGFVDDEALAVLYSGADALVFPSSYEGFGIPVLEARACGTRVVATDLPELREAGGDDTIYVPPTEHGVRVGVLQALASNRPEPLPPRECSWAESARIFARVLTRTQAISAGHRREATRAC
jgi:glycosyltransferase involved in cell wall biosynthesis